LDYCGGGVLVWAAALLVSADVLGMVAEEAPELEDEGGVVVPVDVPLSDLLHPATAKPAATRNSGISLFIFR